MKKKKSRPCYLYGDEGFLCCKNNTWVGFYDVHTREELCNKRLSLNAFKEQKDISFFERKLHFWGKVMGVKNLRFVTLVPTKGEFYMETINDHLYDDHLCDK